MGKCLSPVGAKESVEVNLALERQMLLTMYFAIPSKSFSNNGLGLLSGLIRYPQYSLAATAVLPMVVGGEAQDFRLLSSETRQPIYGPVCRKV